MVLLYFGGKNGVRKLDERAAFDRRYVTWLALGPFLTTTVIGALTGRLPIAMWGYPLWSFAPLAVLMWLEPVTESRALWRFAAGFIAVFVAVPVIYTVVELGEPFVHYRPKATQFPGQLIADTVTRAWHDRYGAPLTYVSGSPFAEDIVAVYSRDRPHAIVEGELRFSPWIDKDDLRRRGAVLIWQEAFFRPDSERFKATFGDIEVQPVLVAPMQTLHPIPPERFVYAFVPPRP